MNFMDGYLHHERHCAGPAELVIAIIAIYQSKRLQHVSPKSILVVQRHVLV